jgi:hypothetical protein
MQNAKCGHRSTFAVSAFVQSLVCLLNSAF